MAKGKKIPMEQLPRGYERKSAEERTYFDARVKRDQLLSFFFPRVCVNRVSGLSLATIFFMEPSGGYPVSGWGSYFRRQEKRGVEWEGLIGKGPLVT